MSYVQPSESDYIAMEVQRRSAEKARDAAGAALRGVENLELRVENLERHLDMALVAIAKLIKERGNT